MSKLVNDLIRHGYLKSDLIIDAFSEIDRIEFVPEDMEREAEVDMAMPIGYGQTISQPSVVALMLELLEPQRGQNILDAGSGSGWTTVLLAYIVGDKGKVIAVERIKELMEFGQKNADKFGYVKKNIAEFHCGDASQGFAPKAPFDRILVSAAAETVPSALKGQLKIGGKMVIPVKNSIFCIEKIAENKFKEDEIPGFSFVPLIIEK